MDCHPKFKEKAEKRNYRLYVHAMYGKYPLPEGPDATILEFPEPTVEKQLNNTMQKLTKRDKEILKMAEQLRRYRRY